MENANELIVEKARQYIGQKEIKGNAGWIDKFFQEKMTAVGWEKGQAWCAYFAELVWREVYGGLNSIIETDLRTLFSAGATKTFNNFENSSKYKKYVSRKPSIGALAIFCYGTGWQGHVGIVTAIRGNQIKLIEGNTNAVGGREGEEVAEKTRMIDYNIVDKRLNLMGFIHPPEY